MRVRWKLTDGSWVTLRVRKSDVENFLERFSFRGVIDGTHCVFCDEVKRVRTFTECAKCRIQKQVAPNSCVHFAGLHEAIQARADIACSWATEDHESGINTLRNFRRRIRAAVRRATV